jgi:reactive intermediate/imine deaminase
MPRLLLACLLTLGSWMAADGKKVIHVPGWPKIPIFSTATVVGELVFISGMVGMDFTATPLAFCEGGVGAETECALKNIRSVMQAAGSLMENVVDCQVFLATMDDFNAMNAVYIKWFPKDPPSRAAVAVASLAAGAKVEIKCVGSL